MNSVFTTPPPSFFLRRGPFFESNNVCNSQENGVRTRCAAIANHSVIVNSLCIVNLLCVVSLVRRGPLGGAEFVEDFDKSSQFFRDF